MHTYFACLHSLGLTIRQITLLTPDEDYRHTYETLDHSHLTRIGVREDRIPVILDHYRRCDPTRIEQTLADHHVHIVMPSDREYPSLLRHVPTPPPLYVRGTLRDIPMIAVVGSRKHTSYSERILPPIIRDLVSGGYGIVSGGAYGVDSLAHSATLRADGYTISVIGTGIDIDYPSRHRGLFEEIVTSGGAVVSEFALGTNPDPYHFPIRNATIAGIARGIVVAEA